MKDATSDTSERETRGRALGYDLGGEFQGEPTEMAERRPLEVTSWELCWTSVGLVTLGALAGWGLSDEGELVRAAFANASGADWIAAFGTWVIGISAVTYSRAAHKLRVRELNEAADRQARERNAARSDLFRRILSLYGATFEITNLGENRSELTVGDVRRGRLIFLEDVSHFTTRESDNAILTASISSKLASAQSILSVVRGNVIRYSEWLDGRSEHEMIEEVNLRRIDFDVSESVELDKYLDRICGELKSEREPVREMRKKSS
ncbi:hypothetical protein V3391_06715 [Luteimonas sp. SMYT11W]|uniref:DUF3137 domain-containing protein n=1 Tax=Luteimonas flava TaxID=3115822 RepID=A0ABU7WD65_9GAMM